MLMSFSAKIKNKPLLIIYYVNQKSKKSKKTLFNGFK